MIGRSVRKGPKALQKIELVFSELRNCGEGFGPSQNRRQGKQQDLIQRVDYLDELPWIRQIREMIQKNNALCSASSAMPSSQPPNRINWGFTNSALPPFCHALTHPIALHVLQGRMASSSAPRYCLLAAQKCRRSAPGAGRTPSFDWYSSRPSVSAIPSRRLFRHSARRNHRGGSRIGSGLLDLLVTGPRRN